MARKQSSRWSGDWSIQTADAAYQLIKSAGENNATSKGQLDAITAAAAKGDPVAVKVMTYFTPIAKMVELNIGPPSKLQEQRRFDDRAGVYEDRAEALEQQLEERTISDGRREELEGEVAAYAALVARVDAAKAGEPEPELDPTESQPDIIEGEASMSGEDYPTGSQGGAPEDVEFTED
jgi:hypothetical protein